MKLHRFQALTINKSQLRNNSRTKCHKKQLTEQQTGHLNPLKGLNIFDRFRGTKKMTGPLSQSPVELSESDTCWKLGRRERFTKEIRIIRKR